MPSFLSHVWIASVLCHISTQPCLDGVSVVPSVSSLVWVALVLCQVSSALSGWLQCCAKCLQPCLGGFSVVPSVLSLVCMVSVFCQVVSICFNDTSLEICVLHAS